MKKIKECYPNWLTSGGIISDITTYITDPIWGTDMDLALSMDLQYFGNHSGNKCISNLVKAFGDDPLSVDNRRKLAKICYAMYKENWKNLYNAYIADYDPIENYNMTETEKGTITIDTDSTANVDNTIKTTNAATGSGTEESDKFGFNSSAAVHDSKMSSSHKEDSTVDTSNKSKNTMDGSSVEDRDLEKKRHGNLGVTTSQQMIKSSVDLYEAWDFWNSIFNDIDKVLTCGCWVC